MANWGLTEIFHKIMGDKAEQSFLLVPDSTEAEFTQAETAIGTLLPPTIKIPLERWQEQGSEVLLSTLPQILNPSATHDDLEPAAKPMRELFPVFCAMLDNTEDFGVMLNPRVYRANAGGLLYVGTGQQLIAVDSVECWVSFEPKTLQELNQWEIETGILLSPQMRQMLLRVDGTHCDYPPYFFPMESLVKGSLASLYEEFWDEMDSEEPFEKLTKFVSIYEDGCGNEQGFFCDEVRNDGEYTIYDWDHETVKFTEIAPDFASWLEQLLTRGW